MPEIKGAEPLQSNYELLLTVPELNEEEKQILQERMMAGDIEARNIFICSHFKLARKFCQAFATYSDALQQDLYQECCVALIMAADSYDPSKGAKYSTYAYNNMRHYTTKYLRKNTFVVNVSDHLSRDIIKVQREVEHFTMVTGYSPEPEDICEILKMSAKKVEKLMRMQNSLKPADNMIQTEDGEYTDRVELIPSTDSVEDTVVTAIIKEEVNDLVHSEALSEMEQEIIRKRYGLNGEEKQTLQEISNETGKSVNEIFFTECRAIRALEAEGKRRRLEEALF